MLKVYELHPTTTALGKDSPWTPGYDKLFGAVVLANSPEEARKIIAESNYIGDEGKEVWLDSTMVSCVDTLRFTDAPRVILTDFKAG